MKFSIFHSFFFLITFIQAEKHLNENGPFGKIHTGNDHLNRRPCKKTSPNETFLINDVLKTLNVSTTIYSSNEQIKITWPTISTLCSDDFIGIYSAEIPLNQGN